MSEISTARKRCADLIATLSVKSEVPAASFDPSGHPQADGGENSQGGNRPGGTDRDAGRLTEQELRDRRTFALKPHQHFVRRLEGCRTLQDYELVEKDLRDCIKHWEKTPITFEVRPGDPFHRRKVVEMIAEHPDWSDEKIGLECGGVSRQRINRIRLEEQRAA